MSYILCSNDELVTMGLRRRKPAKTRGIVRSPAAQVRQFLPLSSLAERDPMDRVRMVKEGVPAELLVAIAAEMAITKEKLYATIGLPRATADRKVRQQQRLTADESERALGIASLVAQVERVVRESGDVRQFDAAKWAAGWLDRPHPALQGERPASFMDTAEGRRIVSDLVAQMQSGAYA